MISRRSTNLALGAADACGFDPVDARRQYLASLAEGFNNVPQFAVGDFLDGLPLVDFHPTLRI